MRVGVVGGGFLEDAKIALLLRGVDLGAGIAGVDDLDRGVVDRDPRAVEAGDHLLVDRPLEADLRAVWKKPDDFSNHAGLAAIRAAFVKQVVGAIRWPIDQGAKSWNACLGQVFIGVQNKNPSASGGRETDIPCGAEVVAPFEIQNTRPTPLSDVCGFVSRARIHHDHFAGEAFSGIDASRNERGFIFRDQDERQEWIKKPGQMRGGVGFEKIYKGAQKSLKAD